MLETNILNQNSILDLVQATCADNNGGCSHYCFDRGDGNGAQCSCPCGMKLSSDTTCTTSFPCINEFYILIDISSYTDQASCTQLRAGQSARFTQFTVSVASYRPIF